MLFNINDVVRVKLTDRGREAHHEWHNRLFRDYLPQNPFVPRKEDADGWSVWQLWYLMWVFGDQIRRPPLLFDTTIELVEDDP